MTWADRWERQAERVNAKRAAEAPLLAAAGLLEQVTPEQRRTQVRRSGLHQSAKMRELHARLCGDIAHRLHLLSAFVEPESLEALEAHRWRVYPPTPEYGASFWREVWDRLRAGEPAAPSQYVAPSPREDAANQERVRRLLALWQQGDAQHPDLFDRACKGDQRAGAELSAHRRQAEEASAFAWGAIRPCHKW